MAKEFRARRRLAALVAAGLGAWLLARAPAGAAVAQATRTAEKRELAITVVARGGEPAAAVRLVVGRLEAGDSRPGAGTPRLSRDDLAAVERGAAVATTDAAGKATLPRPDGPLVAIARRGRERAIALVAPDAPPAVSLTLESPPAVTVAVVDDAHAPVADVAIALVAGLPNFPKAIAIATSGADGRVEFGDLDLFDERTVRTQRFGVSLEIPQEERRAVGFDVKSPPADPVELVAPPTGRLVVELRDEHGELVEAEGKVTAAPRYDFTRRRVTLASPSPAPVRVNAPFVHGRAIFPRVLVGLELDLSCTLAPDRNVFAQTAGPKSPGDEVVAVVRRPPPGPILTGRILDATSAPLASVPVEFVLSLNLSDDAFFLTRRAETDEAGRFRVDAGGGPLGQGAMLAISVGHAADGWTTRQSVPAPAVIDGVADLGELRMPAFQELGRGVVVDDEGHPLAGITLGVIPLDRTAPHQKELNDRARLAHANSGARGEFVLRGEPLPPGFAITILFGVDHGFDFVAPDPVPLTGDSRELKFVLTRIGSIHGQLVLSPDASSEDLDFKLTRADRHSSPVYTSPITAFDGAFWYDRVEPGTYDLAISTGRRGNAKHELARIEGFVVPPGAAAADPRLAAIDLRGRVHSIEVFARTADGKPVRKAQLMSLPIAGEPRRILGWIDEGRGVLSGEGDDFDFEVRAERLRFETVRGAREHATVVMKPGLALRVRVDPAPPDFTITRLDAFRAEDKANMTSSIFSLQNGEIVAPREVLFALPSPGAYELSMYATWKSGATPTTGRVTLPPDVARIEVGEPPDGREAEVTIRVDSTTVSQR